MFASSFEKTSHVKLALSKAVLVRAVKAAGKAIPDDLLRRLKFVDEVIPGTEEHAWLMKLLSKDPKRTANRIADRTIDTLFFGANLPQA